MMDQSILSECEPVYRACACAKVLDQTDVNTVFLSKDKERRFIMFILTS